LLEPEATERRAVEMLATELKTRLVEGADAKRKGLA
jgi:hypothetical protein